MMVNMNIMTLHERIHRRSGHIAVSYQDSIIVWGGFMEGHLLPHTPGQHPPNEPPRYHYTDEIWQYQHETEVWQRLLTGGEFPPPNCGCCGVMLGDSLYVFGGFYQCDDMIGNTNRLYRLHLPTLHWDLLEPQGHAPTPCDKLAGWAYEDKVYFFGGFGPKPSSYMSTWFELDPNTLQSVELRGWNNQLVAYEPHTNKWIWPKVGGETPSPRAAHAADISGDKAYVFGGRFRSTRRNDLMCLDYSTMRWSTVNLSSSANLLPVPPGRSWHSFTFVTPDVAIVYGGLSNHSVILNDCWAVNVVEKTVSRIWKNTYEPTSDDPFDPVKNPTKTLGRFWLQTVASPKRESLSIVGGTTAPNNRINLPNKGHVEELLVLEFTPKTLFRLSLDAVLKTVPAEEWFETHSVPKTVEDTLTLRLEQTAFH